MFKQALVEYVSKFGTGISKENFVAKCYYEMRRQGFDVVVLNDLYLICGDESYQLIKRKKEGRWEVKVYSEKPVHTQKCSFYLN